MSFVPLFEEFKLLEEAKDHTIFCDMDGILTNFNKSFSEIPENDENLTPRQFEKKYGKNSIWPLIKKEGIEFWSEMEWMPDGKKFWNFIKPFKPIILSAPSREPESAEGKLIWIKRELGINQNKATRSPKPSKWDPASRIIFNSDKYLFARGPQDILIDDTPKKIEDWINKRKAIGILHESADKSIKKLRQILSV